MYVLKNKFLTTIIFIFDCVGLIISFPVRIFKKMPSHPEKILIIRLDHIGDVLSSTHVFKAIKQKFPETGLSVLVGKWSKDIIANNPYIDEILTYDAPWFKRRGFHLIRFKEFFRLASELRRCRYDLGIDLRGDLRHIALMCISGIRYKIGYGITGGGFLLDKEMGYNPRRHVTKCNLDLLKTIGIDTTDGSVDIYITEKEGIFAKGLFGESGVKEGDFTIIIHPGAGYPSKLWPNKRWAALIKRLHEQLKPKAVIVGSKEDADLYKQIRGELDFDIIDATGKTSLGSLAALIKDSQLFIGTDSGPSHIASAVGTPTVILYSGTNDKHKWAPRGKNVSVIQKDVPCRLCEKTDCADNICMDMITVDEVLEHVSKII